MYVCINIVCCAAASIKIWVFLVFFFFLVILFFRFILSYFRLNIKMILFVVFYLIQFCLCWRRKKNIKKEVTHRFLASNIWYDIMYLCYSYSCKKKKKKKNSKNIYISLVAYPFVIDYALYVCYVMPKHHTPYMVDKW